MDRKLGKNNREENILTTEENYDKHLKWESSSQMGEK